MKSLALIALAISVTVTAHAGRREGTVRDIPLTYNNSLTVVKDVREHSMKFDTIRIAKKPTQMRELNPCRYWGPDSDIEICEEPVKETRAEVVEVSFSYDDNCGSDCSYASVDLQFPMSEFSAETIAQIRELNRGTFDLLGKKASRRVKLTNALIETTISLENVTVDDYECTKPSRLPDSDLCDEQTKVGEHQVQVKVLRFSVRK